MHLTDEQWRLIEPILPEPSPFSRGRPPFDPRLVMDGILCKIRLAVPWYDLPFHDREQPPAAGEQPLPSWQTCYRAYALWKRQGLMDQVYRLLYQDLRQRAGLDFFQLLEDGALDLTLEASGSGSPIAKQLQGTWQGATLQLLTRVVLLRILEHRRTHLAP